MKENIFNQYVERVIDIFGIDKEMLFSRSRKREIADARQLLYYLCHKRQMKIVTIQALMENNNHAINHHSVSHGLKIVSQKVEEDRDYRTIIKKIEESVFI
jgi:chromosomal replication initiation ATPase DnaA